MPKGTYKNKKLAKKNAKNYVKLTGCDGVKIESNKKNYKSLKN